MLRKESRAGITSLVAAVIGIAIVAAASLGFLVANSALSTTNSSTTTTLSSIVSTSTSSNATGGTGTITFYPVTITFLNSSTTVTTISASPSSGIPEVSASAGSDVTVYYRISSPIQGTFYVTLNQPGAYVTPSLIQHAANFSLATGVQAVYPKGNVVAGQSSIVLSIVISLASNVSSGTIPLQITAYQHQQSGPGGYQGSSIPVFIKVS